MRQGHRERETGREAGRYRQREDRRQTGRQAQRKREEGEAER